MHNPNNPIDLVCAIDGHPDPTYYWNSSTKGSLPAKGNTLSIDVATRQSGEVENITCEGKVGELNFPFFHQNNLEECFIIVIALKSYLHLFCHSNGLLHASYYY